MIHAPEFKFGLVQRTTLCVLFLCSRLPPVSQSVSLSVCLYSSALQVPLGSRAPEPQPSPALHLPPAGVGSHHVAVISRWQLTRKIKTTKYRVCVCAWKTKKNSLRVEMSAFSPELVPSGEPNRAGAEAEPQQAAGILQPQTVFVILDSAETLNLVR